jgi:hypothetical protein
VGYADTPIFCTLFHENQEATTIIYSNSASVGSSVAIQEIYRQYGNIIFPHPLLAIII